MRKENHDLDDNFLNIQNNLLTELSKLIPEEKQETFLLFWIENYAKDFRNIYIWIEMNKEIKMEIRHHKKATPKDFVKDVLIAISMSSAIFLYAKLFYG